MQNPDNPKEIWSSLLWSHTNASPQPFAISIAFEPHATWSSQNFWQLDIDRLQFPTNSTPTNVIQLLLVSAREHRTDRSTESGAIVSDSASDFYRGQILVKFIEDHPQSNVVSLATSYGHELAADQSTIIPDLYRIQVPFNQELLWAGIYGTNSAVQYAELNGISWLCPLNREHVEQDAAHIFQNPRAGSENGER